MILSLLVYFFVAILFFSSGFLPIGLTDLSKVELAFELQVL